MSLKRIALRDFVIVRELELDLADGFSVLTGETGAGKSILIDALQLALGARADGGVVREGAARADISAEFDLPAGLAPWLEEAGFETEDSLLLRRSIDSQGKSRAWINGSPATATQLRELADQLVDIHGQHAWQSLTRPDAVRGLLDAYAGVSTQPLQQLWQRWRAAQKTLADARAAQDSLQRERERLAWQIGEVDKLAPGADEWDELNTSHTRLANAQSLLEAAAGRAAGAGRRRGRRGAQPVAGAVAAGRPRSMSSRCSANSRRCWPPAWRRPRTRRIRCRRYLRKTDLDPQRLAELDERMSLWMSLSRRYKRTPPELPALLAVVEAGTGPARCGRRPGRAGSRREEGGRGLPGRSARAVQGPRQGRAAAGQGRDAGHAGPGHAGRPLRSGAAKRPSSRRQGGLEEVAFLVAGHAGSTPRPVGKVASGGELSRIALAIAVTTSRLGTAQTLIFDEVDAGVGGAVAETVGRLMKQLGRDRQVLAVTHLPQVAACADHHLVVAKQSDAVGRVQHAWPPVQGEQRVAEVARMLGGERLSGTTLAHAKEMLGNHAARAKP